MPEVRWLNEREAAAWRSLQMMNLRLDAELARDLAKHSDLSYQDYVVLVALTDRPDGSMRLFELAQVLGWEGSRLSHHITRMIDRGLVTKVKCESDRRGAVVAVSDKGQERIADAAPSHVNAVRREFVDLLSPEQLDALAEVAGIVLDHLIASCEAAAPCPPADDLDVGAGEDCLEAS